MLTGKHICQVLFLLKCLSKKVYLFVNKCIPIFNIEIDKGWFPCDLFVFAYDKSAMQCSVEVTK